jgi:drug/metabolite transporter (DMT)-like permease
MNFFCPILSKKGDFYEIISFFVAKRNSLGRTGKIQQLLVFNMAMVFLSTSGPLGRYVTTAPALTIWLRCLFAALALYAILRFRKMPIRIRAWTHFKHIFVSSLFLSAHWITYFYALKFSNVAVAMLSLFTFPVITALLEPVLLKTRFLWSRFIMALMVMLGVVLLVPELSIDNKVTLGALLGLISAVLYALRNLMLKKYVQLYSAMTLMYHQMLYNALILWPAVFIFDASEVPSQLPWILALALLTTTLGHTLFVYSFKKFSITAASIMSSLQPLFGIIMAIMFLNEIPATQTLLGGAIILFTVLVESYRSVK